jgi:adenosylcobinamide-GDP ribazoletransferase
MRPFWVALSTLTLIPIPTANPSPDDLKRSVIFFPLVGVLLGLVFFGLHQIPLAADLQALVILLCWVGLTGAFHLDGLGDCLDGFFGGRTPQDRQRIMKAANLGTYGMAGITLTLIAKYVLLNHLLLQERSGLGIFQNSSALWLIAIPTAARWGVSFACFIAKAPAGNQGLGSQLMGVSPLILFLSTLLGLVGCIALKGDGLTILGLAAGIAWGVSRLSQSRIGGLTGDGMGMMIELTEVGALLAACLLHP